MSHSHLLEQPIPIGVFWDMENCSVPLKYSALEFVTNIRDQFYEGHFEVDFVGVCDIHTQRKNVLIELSYAQVTTIHVCNTCKNAADDKLRLLIRKFASMYSSPATIILVTSDINFSPELSDLRYKHNYRTILVHGRSTSSSLLSIPNETFFFDGFFTTFDALTSLNRLDNENILFVRNLPFIKNSSNKLKGILEKLFSTTKGKVLSLTENIAIIKFPNFEAALRAKARHSNQRIGGRKIDISIPNGVLLHRVMPNNNFLGGPKVAVAAKIACDLLPYGSSGILDQISTCRKECLDIFDKFEGLSNDIETNPDNTNKGWKAPGRQCMDSNMTSLLQSPHPSNKLVVAQVFRYTDCMAKTGNLDAPVDDSFHDALTVKHSDKMHEIHPDGSGASNHHFSPTNYRNISFSSSRGRNVLVNRKLFPDSGDGPWTRTSASQKYLSPKSYYEANMCFRRTPGARRPNTQPQVVTQQFQQDLRPQLLFTSNAWPSKSHGIFSEKHFQPQHHKKWHNINQKDATGVDLIVSNLDYNISTHEWKKILSAEFQNVQVRSLNVEMQANNTSVAMMTVATMEDAKYVVSQFHRKKIGYKRIHVMIVNPGNSMPQTETLKSNIVNTLSSTPGHKLPLIQFFELFEKRYQKRLTILDLQELGDNIEVIDHEGLGKLITLHSEDSNAEKTDVILCRHFCANNIETSLWEGVDMNKNPKVKLPLKGFSTHIHRLLQFHEGSLPLNCFPACYAREFSSLKLILDEEGVSLEHLVTCVPGVEIVHLPGGEKQLQWSENNPSSPMIGGLSSSQDSSPVLSEQLKQLNLEVVELLKNTNKCSIELSKFFTIYQQYFGRQCRCSDFGCNNLNELLGNFSQSIQVVGSGGTSSMTFTHQAQISRFSSDVLRVLKVQAKNQMDVADLPLHYGNIIGKPLDVTEFGVCFIEDMLAEVPASSFLVMKTSAGIFLSTPTREQSTEEVATIRKYKDDLVLLLRQSQDHCIPYDNFMATYHQHFGSQFKLAECGLSQVSQFFHTVSDSIKITLLLGEKYLSLSESEHVKLAKDQFLEIFGACNKRSIEVTELYDFYMKEFGHPWKLKDCGVTSFEELIEKFNPEISLKGTGAEQAVVLRGPGSPDEISSNILLIIMDFSEGCMLFNDLLQTYQDCFCDEVTESFVAEHMKELVVLERSTLKTECLQVALMPAQMFARDVRLLFLSQDLKQIPLLHFGQSYELFFKQPLKPDLYNHQSLASLFKAASKIISFDGCHSNWNISLQPKFQFCLNRAFTKFNKRCPDPVELLNESSKMMECLSIGLEEIDQSAMSNIALEGKDADHNSSQFSSSADLLRLANKEKEKKPQKPISDLMAFAAKLLPADLYKHSHLKKIERCDPNKYHDKDKPNCGPEAIHFSASISQCTPLNSGSKHSHKYQPAGIYENTCGHCTPKDAFGCKAEECSSVESSRYGPYGESYDDARSEIGEEGEKNSLDETHSTTEVLPPALSNSTSTPVSDGSSTIHRPLGSSLRRPRIVAKFNLAS